MNLEDELDLIVEKAIDCRLPLKMALAVWEKCLITRVLDLSGWNVCKAAEVRALWPMPLEPPPSPRPAPTPS
jgi:hypothetical protein